MAKHPLYTDLTINLCSKVMQFIPDNRLKTYIVTGAARTLCASTPSGCTGSRPRRWSAPPGDTKYGDKNGKPFLNQGTSVCRPGVPVADCGGGKSQCWANPCVAQKPP